MNELKCVLVNNFYFIIIIIIVIIIFHKWRLIK